MVKFAGWDKTVTLCAKCTSVGKIAVASPARQVLVMSELALANGDPCPCLCSKAPCPCGDPSKNIINSGAAQILVGPDMAPFAGMLDITLHNNGTMTAPDSIVLLGSGLIWLGGNTVVGNVALMNRICLEHVKQRLGEKGNTSGMKGQKYQNCALECVRQIVNASRPPDQRISEDDCLNKALDDDNASMGMTEADFLRCCPKQARAAIARLNQARVAMGKPGTDEEQDARSQDYEQAKAAMRDDMEACASSQRGSPNYKKLLERAKTDPRARKLSGGTSNDNQVAALEGYGIPAETHKDTERTALIDGVIEGRGVIANIDASKAGLTKPGESQGEGHAVVVTGVEYNDQGTPVAYRINDPMSGECGASIDRSKFDKALESSVITKKPIGR